MEKKETMGKVEILLATIIWGFAFVVIRDALTVVPFHMLMVWRYTIAVAMMVLLFRKQIRKVDRELLFEGAVLGLLLYISQCFQTGALGFADTTAGKVGFITSLYVCRSPFLVGSIARKKKDQDFAGAVGSCRTASADIKRNLWNGKRRCGGSDWQPWIYISYSCH